MSAPTWEQIIDAVLVGDARVGRHIKREITAEVRKRAIRVLEALQAKEYERASQNAAERQNGANSSDLESLSDRGDIGAGGNAVNVTADTALETVDDDAGKSDAVNVANAPVLVLPEAGGRGDGKSDYPRFHPMKGFSKVQRKIWHWLDEHAAEVNHKYPTQRDVAEAVGTTHPTAGKYLKQWRMHNNITTPDFYQDQAS